MCSSLLSQSTLDSFIKSIDNYLHNKLQKSWQDDYKKRQNLHAELQACDNKLTGEKEAWRKIEILAQVTDYDDYKNLLDCFLEKYNKHQLANYHQGLQLHREHDSQGITTLIKASKEWSPIQHFAFWLLSELSQDKEKAESYYIQYLKALDYFEEINERCA